uniref:Ycf62 n=1 Tax=Massjukichlorella minus TaxID=2650457 RepID=UPI0024116533|nr:Ycf62 [Massjukichlorella minus]WDY13004.1 Ycf62 [Massjukichlorella minus]
MKSKQINVLQFVNIIRQNITQNKLVQPKDHILVTVSGGQDSICLWFILYLLQIQLNFKFDLILGNHFWQTSSFFTMLHVTKLSYSLSSKILLVLPLKKVLSEQSARYWRYNITERTSLFHKYSACTQGHSKTDRIETILFNLFRGAGLAGISALRWKRIQSFSSLTKFYPGFSQFIQSTHTSVFKISEFEIALKDSILSFQLPIYISQNIVLPNIESQTQEFVLMDQLITLQKNIQQKKNNLTVTNFSFLTIGTFPLTLVERSFNWDKNRIKREVPYQMQSKLKTISDASKNNFSYCRVKKSNLFCRTFYYQLKNLTV